MIKELGRVMEVMGCIVKELKSLEGGESGDGLWVCQTGGGRRLHYQADEGEVDAMTFADKVYNLKVLRLHFSQAMCRSSAPNIILVESLSEVSIGLYQIRISIGLSDTSD